MSDKPTIYVYTDDYDDEARNSKCGKCSVLRCSSLTRSMDVLSMIKHSIISDEVNPITKYFDIRQHTGSCGPEMIWKIYDAVRVEDNKVVSVFVFEKKIADKLHKPRRREVVCEILRREVQFLEKLKHPMMLHVVHPLEECHNSLAFATEHVYASLANLLGNHERMPIPVPTEVKDHSFIELEVKKGLLQITEALTYLHGTEQLIHRNVCPQSILVTKKGNWKLSGLGFAEKVKDGKDSISCQPWSTKMPKLAQPNLNFIAPEVQNDKKCSMVSDMFSLGMTICCLYNTGQSPILADHSVQMYTKQLDQLTQVFGDIAHRMPLPLVEPVEKMINKDTRYRPTAQLFSLLKYFHDPVVACLHQLDNVDPTDPVQQAEVYTNLVQVIPNIPRKVLYKYVFTTLVETCQSFDTMIWSFPALITIIDAIPKNEYVDMIMPQFRNILNAPKPMQATVYLLDKLDIILAKTPVDEIKNEIIPLVFNTLDSNCIQAQVKETTLGMQAQEVALGSIRIIKEYLDDSILKSMVLPRAKSLFNKSDNIKMRMNALICIDHLLDSLDKMMILDEVLPFLIDISCQDAKIVMAVVGIYKHLLSDKKFGLTHNLIATKVMPPLIPQTVNPGLSMEQFSALMEVLRDMLGHIDRQRRDKMRQETVSAPIPQRGLINMQADGPNKDERICANTRNYLSVDDAVHIQKSRTEYSFSSLPSLDPRSNTTATDPAPIKLSIRRVPATPESHQRGLVATTPNMRHKTLGHNHNASGGSLDECALNPPQPSEIQRRLSLAPPSVSGTPIISLPSDENLGADKKRRPSAQSLGPFSFSVSYFGDSRRSSLFSTDTRRSSERLRRPSTHSVGILPIAMFGGEGPTEKPRKPSTHSLGVLPYGWNNGHDEYYRSCDGRRPSAHSLGPLWNADGERRGSRGSMFGGLGPGEGHPPTQRRASFQALGESVMQLFSSK